MDTKLEISAAGRALAVLRERILTGELPGGSRLIERGLCDELGVSRTAVRESLIRLAGDGLVNLIPDAGATVEPLTERQVIDAYVMRQAIEQAAAEQCATRMSREQVGQLLELAVGFEAQFDACCRGEPHGLNELDHAFHRLIVQGSGNGFLERGAELATLHLVRGIKGPPEEMASSESRTAIVDDHLAVARAIADGDADRAGLVMKQHIQRGRSLLIQRLRRMNLQSPDRG